MLGEHSGKSAETKRGLDVSDNPNGNHRGSLNDGNSIDDLTLVHEGTGTVDTTDNVGHTGLVTTEGGEVGSLSLLVLGKRSDVTGMLLGTLLGQETQGTLSWSFEFTVRPVIQNKGNGKNMAGRIKTQAFEQRLFPSTLHSNVSWDRQGIHRTWHRIHFRKAAH
jgi:hypothetical protein